MVNFQALPELVRVEVMPATPAMGVGGQVPLTALGHYSDGTVTDVTQHTTWTTGDSFVAGFSGNVLTGLTEGYATVRATVAGIHNDDAAMATVSNDTAPKILYAGWGDTYLTTSSGGSWRLEARVADAQNDVIGVLLFSAGTPLYEVVFNDDGTGLDMVAGDGTWTADVQLGPGVKTADVRFELLAVDQTFAVSSLWPYFKLEGPNPVAWANGLPLFPFAAESYSPPPPVLLGGTGFSTSSVVPSEGGSVTLIARQANDDPIDAIHVFLLGILMPAQMNDDGLGADQLAGDGLWTGSLTLPPMVPASLLFEFVPQRNGVGFGDAYPRLRIHN